MGMKLLADENIPLAAELFGTLGAVTLVPGRDVDEGFPGLSEFDVLAVRSVTRVTPALVDAARRARVIATATIGTDHIDTAYIHRANAGRECPIDVFSAPGSNAESVADYVFYAIAHLTRSSDRLLADMSIGIVGLGNCGRRVARRARGFGMAVLPCDPPRAEAEPYLASVTLDEALQADFVTCHVPLTRPDQSAHPTFHMIDAARLASMRHGSVLINSSRGAVVDSQALVEALRHRAIGGAVLDVFEGEPEPAAELISLPAIVTPHIAGYAVEGKRRGAVVIYEAACRALGVEPVETGPLLLRGFEPPQGAPVALPRAESPAAAADEAVRRLMAGIHDIVAVSDELKTTLDRLDRARLFDAMRKNYERDYARHELACYRVGFGASMDEGLREAIERRLAGLGMQVVEAGAHFVFKLAGDD